MWAFFVQCCLERGSGVTDDGERCRGATSSAVRGRHTLEGHKSNTQKQLLLWWRCINK
jgi:hypothetical protein